MTASSPCLELIKLLGIIGIGGGDLSTDLLVNISSVSNCKLSWFDLLFKAIALA